jgi:hypothetical protein
MSPYYQNQIQHKIIIKFIETNYIVVWILPTKTISKSVYEDGMFGLLGPPPDDLDYVWTNFNDVLLLLITLLIDLDIIFVKLNNN